MIEIFILALVVGWIARIARTRGASPWLFGTLAVIGFLVFPVVLSVALRSFEQSSHAEQSLLEGSPHADIVSLLLDGTDEADCAGVPK